MERNNFQVDLGGLVELLSRNLYSGPRVFVRELLQNGVDAITARRETEPGCPAHLDVEVSADRLRFTDSGKGLTLEEAGGLLATIGASSKRDEFGLQRTDYLGQFGIGMLSALMVSPSIVVYSRSTDALDKPIRWEGSGDGTWSVRPATQEEVPAALRGAGTTVELSRMDFDFLRVPDLLDYYGQYLPVEITVNGQPLERPAAPWNAGEDAQAQWCKENFGFEPFACIPLSDAASGLKGVAFITPAGAHPGQHVKHQVYLHNMLLSDRVGELLPEWAYFARAVVTVENLRPTASREALADDEALEETRVALGDHIRAWLNELAIVDPHEFSTFVALHSAGLKSLALVDEPTRRLVARAVPVLTTVGPMTMDEVLERHGAILYTRSVKDYEAIASVASATEMCVVNAGYAFDEEILQLLRLDYPQATIEELDPAAVLAALAAPSPTERAALSRLVADAEEALRGQDVDIALRRFEPESLAAIFIPQADAAGQAIERQAEEEDPLIALMTPPTPKQRSQLVLNAACPTLHRLSDARAGQAPAGQAASFGQASASEVSAGQASFGQAPAGQASSGQTSASEVSAGQASFGQAPAGQASSGQLRNNSARAGLVTAALRGIYLQALIAANRPLNAQARGWSANLFTAFIDLL